MTRGEALGSRVFGLDVLRAAAILFVVYGHGYELVSDKISESVYSAPVFDGVTLFFVLSGYLIGRMLIRSLIRDDLCLSDLTTFWIRRWFRTLPNYFFVLALLTLASWPVSLSVIFTYSTFTQNIAWPHPTFFAEAWSLAVEEWFYLVVPIPLFVALKSTRVDRRWMIVCWATAVIVGVTTLRLYRAQYYSYDTIELWDAQMRKQVVTRLDAMMFGVVAAYVSLYHSTAWVRWANVGVVFGAFLLIADKVYTMTSGSVPYLNYLSLSIVSFGTALLLPRLSSWKTQAGVLAGVVSLISLISYSLYLVNLSLRKELLFPLISKVCHSCTAPGWVAYLVYWVATLAVAYLLYRFIERPTMALRDRIAVPPSVADATPGKLA